MNYKLLFNDLLATKKWAFFCAVAIMAGIVVGCVDNVGPDEIRPRDNAITREGSVGRTEDGHDVLVFEEGILDNTLFQIDTTTVSDSGFVGTLLFRDLDEELIPE
ncbi:MAG: hypothetical protein LBU70_06745 [Chitinispirillales bacterium]|jgi:hypothetical protein|nr:hypothetical protein [Chitinispirillales bacterium]